LHTHKIVIQARTQSKRLPNKVIKPFFHDHSILDILCKRLLLYYDPSQIVIAGSILDRDSKIASIAELHEIEVHWGEEQNVLQRVIDAAELTYGDGLIRVCANTPFLDIETMAQLADEGDSYDYCTFQYNSKNTVITSPKGLFAEYVSLAALKKMNRRMIAEYYQDDICNYLCMHSEIFKLKHIPLSEIVEQNRKMRLLIQSEEDFRYGQRVFAKLIEIAGWKFNYKDIINLTLEMGTDQTKDYQSSFGISSHKMNG